jgi:hypothetical protein
MTISEEWFDEYLDANGYSYEEEPDLGVVKHPDRLIERVGVKAICEVKEFTTDAMQRRWPEGGSHFGSFSGEDWMLNVRRAISDKAEQLEPLAGDSRPLVIVLANPHGVRAEITGEKLIEAMYGDLQVTFPWDPETGGPAADPVWTLGGGGRLADVEKGELARWVSGVVGLHRGDHFFDWQREWIKSWKAEHLPEGPRSEDDALARYEAYRAELEEAVRTENPPSGEYLYLHVVEAGSEEAVPLPRDILDADRDLRWVVNREAGTIELLQPPQGVG